MKKLLEKNETLMQIVNDARQDSPIYKPKFSSKTPQNCLFNNQISINLIFIPGHVWSKTGHLGPAQNTVSSNSFSERWNQDKMYGIVLNACIYKATKWNLYITYLILHIFLAYW